MRRFAVLAATLVAAGAMADDFFPPTNWVDRVSPLTSRRATVGGEMCIFAGQYPKSFNYYLDNNTFSSDLFGAMYETLLNLNPLTLDYELNSPDDLEQMYFRSDHYSYAAKGIPIIFFTTGLHPDYHANTDEVSRIEFDKLARVARMVYETGWRVANLDHPPLRDNRGPRAGNPFAPK